MATPAPAIDQAFWLGPRTGCVLLTENWRPDAALPVLALAADGVQVADVQRAAPDFFGRFAGYHERDDGAIVFCQEAHRHAQIDFAQTPVRVVGAFNDWGRAGPAEHWQLAPRTLDDGSVLWECAVPRDRLGAAADGGAFKFVSSDWHWLKVLFCAPNRVSDAAGNTNYVFDPRRTGAHALRFTVAGGRGLDGQHTIIARAPDTAADAPASAPKSVLPGLSFYDLNTDLPLGSWIERKRGGFAWITGEREETVFRVFAPRATGVTVEIFNDRHVRGSLKHALQLGGDELTWEARLPGNLHGWFYQFHAVGQNDGLSTQFDSRKRLLDPWALVAADAAGPGIVFDRALLPRRDPHHGFTPPHWHDLVILEAHVRDLVAHAPVALSADDRLGFRGLAAWIDTEGSYVRTLGVNALELLPINPSDARKREEYAWGYMPSNYFAPNPHYAHAPDQASAIADFKELVDACHRHELAVILDVVYNHVGDPPFVLFLDKQYYLHVEPDGALTNWSGVGNTLRSESAMARRLIIESLTHLVETFDIDGFRFDLAELLTVEVLREIETALKAVKPSIILIAEPWSFRGHIAWELRATGFSFWNDGFREFLARYVRGEGNAEGLRYFLKGSLDHLAVFPAQSVNYVESHDDRCWLDKITENPKHDGRQPTPNDVHRTHLMVATLMTAIGIPMLAEGQDFLRSKHGHHNTYQRGDLNALDYTRLETHRATHEYFRAWIAFRRGPWGELVRRWERPSPDYVKLFETPGVSSAALLFNADRSHGRRQLLFAINPHLEAATIALPEVSAEGWLEVADRARFDLTGVHTERFLADADGPRLQLGPLDCGLWLRED